MEESRSVDRLRSKITERQTYQASIIRALYRHEVWGVAEDIACEIVFNALTMICRVWHACGAGRERALSKTVDRMVNGHSKSKRRMHVRCCQDRDRTCSLCLVMGKGRHIVPNTGHQKTKSSGREART